MQTKWHGPLRIVLGIVFILAGLAKFLKPEAQQPMFEPYPDFFMPLIGIVEIIGGLALVSNRLVRWASLGLAIIMAGAVVTHFVVGISPQVMPSIVLLVLTLLLYLKGQSSEGFNQASS